MTTASASPAITLIIPCPPGSDPGTLLSRLIDAAADAVQHREDSAQPDCPRCPRDPGTRAKTGLCDSCRIDEDARRVHEALFDHLQVCAEAAAA